MAPPAPLLKRSVRVDHVSAETHAALAARDVDRAAALTGRAIPAWLVSDECVGTWQRRATQVLTDTAALAWVTGLLVDATTDLVVGKAGFHGPPDAAGMVEVGYAVDPAYRRRGYAHATVAALLTRARAEPAVRVVRASIAPTNVASQATIAPFGFVVVGEQWDDEDGLEIVHELRVA